MYFKAQASHLGHLARKLEAAVDQAMTLDQSTRHTMIMDALSRRFPADKMMEEYSEAWVEVSSTQGIAMGSCEAAQGDQEPAGGHSVCVCLSGWLAGCTCAHCLQFGRIVPN